MEQILSHWNDTVLSEEEVMKELKSTPGLYSRYFQMDQEWREFY